MVAFPRVFPWFSYGLGLFPWFSYGFPMVWGTPPFKRLKGTVDPRCSPWKPGPGPRQVRLGALPPHPRAPRLGHRGLAGDEAPRKQQINMD